MNNTELRESRQTYNYILENPNVAWVGKLSHIDVHYIRQAASLVPAPEGSPFEQVFADQPIPEPHPPSWILDKHVPRDLAKYFARRLGFLAKKGRIPAIPDFLGRPTKNDRDEGPRFRGTKETPKTPRPLREPTDLRSPLQLTSRPPPATPYHRTTVEAPRASSLPKEATPEPHRPERPTYDLIPPTPGQYPPSPDPPLVPSAPPEEPSEPPISPSIQLIEEFSSLPRAPTQHFASTAGPIHLRDDGIESLIPSMSAMDLDSPERVGAPPSSPRIKPKVEEPSTSRKVTQEELEELRRPLPRGASPEQVDAKLEQIVNLIAQLSVPVIGLAQQANTTSSTQQSSTSSGSGSSSWKIQDTGVFWPDASKETFGTDTIFYDKQQLYYRDVNL